MTTDLQDKSKKLFSYLKELVQLRSGTIREIDTYESVMWLSNIPKESECFAQVWGVPRESKEDVWIEIRKPKLPSLPPPPASVRQWVSEAELGDYKKDRPQLVERILAEQSPNQDPAVPQEPRYLELKDFPAVLVAWDVYLKDKWKPWVADYIRAKAVQDAYTQLFEIYQSQKNLGEEYEVVIGFGLLSWQTPNHQTVKRHLITVQASISLDSNKGVLSVSVPAEGPRPMLEQDMLEAGERPPADHQIKIEEMLRCLADNVWDNSFIEKIARSWLHSAYAEGQYESTLAPRPAAATTPYVTYSPALILRKRTERGLLRVFIEILSQISAGGEIPPGITRTVQIVDDGPGRHEGGSEGHSVPEPQEIYFPLAANDEQLRIVEQVQTRQGVLVQGPPGTGKSHTIVNLICHLLATGQRVLVTSQTSRALRVLKDKMQREPASREIAPLCVSLLGDDNRAMKDLEESVQSITEKHHSWDESKNNRDIESFRKKLQQYRENLAGLHAKLRQLREKETYVIDLCGGQYRGTAQQIAQQMSSEKEKFNWIGDEITASTECPLKNQEALNWLALCRNMTPEKVTEISLTIPDLAKLPSPEQFIKSKESEADATAIHNKYKEYSSDSIYNKFLTCPRESRQQLAEAIDKLLTSHASILNLQKDWIERFTLDILSGRDGALHSLFDFSCKHLNGLHAKAAAADEHQLVLQKEFDRVTAIADLKEVIAHLKAGKSFGIPLLRPAPVRKAWYLIKSVKIDGIQCRSAGALSILLDCLETDEALSRVWTEWAAYSNKGNGNRAAQVRDLEDLCSPLEQLLKLGEMLDVSKGIVDSMRIIPQPAWHIIDEVKRYRLLLDAISAKEDYDEAAAIFDSVSQMLRALVARPGHHDVAEKGLLSVEARDEVSYGKVYSTLAQITQDRSSYDEFRGYEARLRACVPELTETILPYALDLGAHHIARMHPVGMGPNALDPVWDSRLASFEEAWGWARARAALEEINSEETIADIQEDIRNTQKKIEMTTGSLAAALSWKHCFARMLKADQEHLTAWKQAMKRIGKGTGKHAEKHRQEARKNMQGCRGAIPGWIMPLYKVAESITPAPGSYDVVIIDEASQAGPEAIFLQYVAKKIVVVGDDMQISPDSVGIPRQDVDLLRDKYLKDLPLPHIGALGVEETSFFHLAEILFGGRIVLKEHFRCMPEIIQFSNALCYRNTLLPLRHYPPNRLHPVLQARHIPTGYRQGNSTNPLNPPEADAVVEAVVGCCKNSEYNGKTFGVISLLGEAHAKYIERNLLNLIGPEEMEARRIVCGDAYAFQGDERDVIFLSLVAAPGETAMNAITSQKYERRFNVAASRARDQMWLFHTPSINDFRNREDLRYKLVQFFYSPKDQVEEMGGLNLDSLVRHAAKGDRGSQLPPTPFDSWFEVDVFLQASKKGYRVLPQHEMAGYRIDMVIEGAHGRLCVECDGDKWHGPEQYDADMRRQRVLERCGQKFWRIRGSEYYSDPEGTLTSLWTLLDDLGIYPVGYQPPAPVPVQSPQQVHVAAPAVHSAPNILYQSVVEPPKATSTEFKSQDIESGTSLERTHYLKAIMAVMPPDGRMSRVDAIRRAANVLRDQGLLHFERVRENGEIWLNFKSAIHSGIRRGMLDGDQRYIWRNV